MDVSSDAWNNAKEKGKRKAKAFILFLSITHHHPGLFYFLFPSGYPHGAFRREQIHPVLGC